MKRKLLVSIIMLIMTACSSAPKKEIVGKDYELYNNGLKALYSRQYASAINLFEELDRQYPYSALSRKGQIMIVFAHFKNRNFEETIFEADKFIQYNVNHPDLDYVFYMKAMSYYYRISDIKRDQKFTRLAMDSFEQLVNRFPDSKYSRDASQKMKLCYDNLAGKEMEIGRFYLKQGNQLAAVNRFQEVVKKYERSNHVPEALYRIAESYMALGLEDEAVKSLSILGYNYSGNSEWYKRGYDLIKNIDDYELKYQNEQGLESFIDGMKNVFK